MHRLKAAAATLVALCALVALAAPFASARPAKKPRHYPEPALTVPTAEMEAAFHCHGEVGPSSPQPLMFVTGTGASGEQGYLIGRGAFEATGHPVCDVDFPDFTTADIQVSVQYLVYAIRREWAMGGKRPIAIFGISQGGLLPRFALTYWPDLRRKVSDVLAAAGTQHGTNVHGPAGPCAASNPCPPAGWQQAAGSKLLRALNSQPFEAPGPTAWTTVRSETDETVQPQTGKHPTSALRGATNILIQSVCPGRTTTHIGTAVDSVAFAAFTDAIDHKGPAKVSRLPADVCSHPYAPGLDEATTNAFLSASGSLIGGQESSVPLVSAEPKLRPYVRRLQPQAPPPGR
jgi:hypothetical protein